MSFDSRVHASFRYESHPREAQFLPNLVMLLLSYVLLSGQQFYMFSHICDMEISQM